MHRTPISGTELDGYINQILHITNDIEDIDMMTYAVLSALHINIRGRAPTASKSYVQAHVKDVLNDIWRKLPSSAIEPNMLKPK